MVLSTSVHVVVLSFASHTVQRSAFLLSLFSIRYGCKVVYESFCQI